jgi:rare lipoprotein A
VGEGHGAAINGHTNVAGMADDVGGGGDESVQLDNNSGNLPLLAQIFVDIGNFFANLFGLGGGGSNLPPFYFVYQARLTRGGRHPQYPDIDGAAKQITLNQKSAAPLTISGEASYYYPTGRPAGCSGYQYTNPNGLTAAMHSDIVGPHKMFPCGTSADVTFQPPGSNVPRTVTVRVIDHGPYAKGRIIDLSPGAFRALAGDLSEGHIPVTVRVPAGPTPPLQPGS